MDITNRLNFWGKGQLAAYSGLDGETDFRNGIVLRTRKEALRLLRETVRAEEFFQHRYGTFFEFYDDRGECDPPQLLRKGKCAPEESPYHQVFFDYGWSASLYIDMVAQLSR